MLSLQNGSLSVVKLFKLYLSVITNLVHRVDK